MPEFDLVKFHMKYAVGKVTLGQSTSVSSWQYNSTNAPYTSSSTCCTKRETGETLDLHKVVLFVKSAPVDGKLHSGFLIFKKLAYTP